MRFCSLNLNISSGTVHDLVAWQRVYGKRWKTKLLDVQDPWNLSDLANRSSWINFKTYCHQRWKVSCNWLSLSLDYSLNHLDLVKQQKTFHTFSLYKKNNYSHLWRSLEHIGLGREQMKIEFLGQGTERTLGKKSTEAFAHIQEHQELLCWA